MKGYVHLQGAVYDNNHGPQPISIGNAWIQNPFLHPWSVRHDGQEVLQEVRYAGHALRKGRAQLMYNLILKDGKTIRVNEQPEYVEKDGQKGLERAFTLQDVDGYEVSMVIGYVHCIGSKHGDEWTMKVIKKKRRSRWKTNDDH
jgi:hypothetical protein